jgi:hypothetical protein
MVYIRREEDIGSNCLPHVVSSIVAAIAVVTIITMAIVPVAIISTVVVLVILLGTLAIVIGAVVVVPVVVISAMLVFVNLSIVDIVHLPGAGFCVLHCGLETKLVMFHEGTEVIAYPVIVVVILIQGI